MDLEHTISLKHFILQLIRICFIVLIASQSIKVFFSIFLKFTLIGFFSWMLPEKALNSYLNLSKLLDGKLNHCTNHLCNVF